MKKLKNKSGMTLMEIMVSILILVLLVVAMGTGMNSGMKIYAESSFESSSATLADMINTTLSDILAYSEDLKKPSPAIDDIAFLFTNLDYGMLDTYFILGTEDYSGILQAKSQKTGAVSNVVNPAAYHNMGITNFKLTFHSGDSSAVGSGYFTIEYTIQSNADSSLTRNVNYVARLLNQSSLTLTEPTL